MSTTHPMMDAREIERVTGHRPWPLPAAPWVMVQSWHDLLFAHWPRPSAELRPLVPPGLEIEEHDGTAWVGLTAFEMARLRPRLLPPLPGIGRFAEMNLRTYVRHAGRPGVFFFSLDAASRIAVAAARTAYSLPYHTAHAGLERRAGWIHFHSQRDDGTADFAAHYSGIGRIHEAAPGSLEHFLVERYALYSVTGSGDVLRGDIHHLPWSLQQGEAAIERNTVFEAHGLAAPTTPPLLHFAAYQDALVWPAMPADAA